jgi:hypothetical protein
MKDYVLGPPGNLTVLEETQFTWHLTNYTKLPAKNISPTFTCFGYEWSSSSLCPLTLGVYCISPGETIPPKAYLSTSNRSLPPPPPQTGTSAPNLPSYSTTPPTRARSVTVPPCTDSTPAKRTGDSRTLRIYAICITRRCTRMMALLRWAGRRPRLVCT